MKRKVNIIKKEKTYNEAAGDADTGEANPKLPFVTSKSSWAPKSTKDIICNELIGQHYAMQYMEAWKRGELEGMESLATGSAKLGRYSLTHIIKDMVKRGSFDSLELGFISTLADIICLYMSQINVESYTASRKSRQLASVGWFSHAQKLRMLQTLSELEDGKL